MDKRTFLAVVLSIIVYFIFSHFFPVQKPVAPVSQQQAVSTTPAVTPVVVASVQPDVSKMQLRDIKVETDLYTAIFSSRGAGLKSVTLKKFNDQIGPKANPVVLGADADPSIYTFATRLSGMNLSDSVVYAVSSDSLIVSGSEPRQLTFTHVTSQGFTVQKTFTFTRDSYSINLETKILNNTQAPLVGAVQQVMTYPAEHKVKDSRFETAGSFLYADKGLHTDKIKDVASAAKKYDKGAVQWAGYADKYFLTAVLSVNNSIAVAEVKKNAAGFMETSVTSPQLTVNPGQTASVAHKLFVGPKEVDILTSQGNQLEQALDLGWFSIIATPLLSSLKFFYRYVGNYGVAIIIITVILKTLFFPLTHQSYKSMKEMQKIQPIMAELKEKYKDDREAMNRAVMELYREKKVNPMGGCLPMVAQIPVFFALYKALMFSIELRHAPFYLWIMDLSGPDNLFGQMLGLPFVIGPLPIVMGITMFIQQKMTPSNMDPVQAKMMLALPVVFTVMFLSFPSGLVLYWLINNILTIAQQMYINKLVKD